ncbi:FAD binding domain-containing protein [Dactylosporangium sp. NBC_01737]|uniref:FAD binding domain-containing protein n=1 Tax=Dactylosporangium sp. NBC_01737 TaxID=2975959 RepID=UPI002E0E6620|nr:FAD binding domain-containing protein [Dactylosporangium sp. NBC_01737]
MKPPVFDYVAPWSIPEAVDALGDPSRSAAVIAGGQSLLLEMHLTRRAPDLVVDINRIAGLDGLGVDGGALRVGALVRHAAFEAPHAVPGPLGALFGQAVTNIAHPPIRARGTLAGSLAWAHPASEWCAVAVALDAGVALQDRDGVREVAARDYFLGPYRTARRPGELITSVRFPLLGDDTGVGFIEHRRTHFSFATVAVSAALTVRDGVISDARIGLANAADRPVRASAAERSLIGAGAGEPLSGRITDDHLFGRAGRIAAEQDASPVAEPYADAGYKRQVVAVLVGRALRQAATDQRARAGHRTEGPR